MSVIADNLQAVRKRIADAEIAFGRSAGSVKLLAVSKTKPMADLAAAYAAGQRVFGENYVQEGIEKCLASTDMKLEWHFIGPLQSNKTRLVAEHFSWVHSVDRMKTAQRLAQQRPPGLGPINVCVQVNISRETNKSGCPPADAHKLCQAITELPNLRLRGLMTIPEASDDFSLQRQPFRALRLLFAELQAEGLALDTLSMGMTHDLEAAIAEGATLVRIGTAIFGERNYA